ncbi:baseplate assembly protein [Komagataeibacter nataicola]|uniref:Baseplate assembly protein n=2 Tax=Komagataeibacter nataicola TaxID=265960 RepID=A0A9N7H1Y6_9PROT|nr:baseplate assembly protein [Komagataeibacter nataicola]AQU86238.1 baseplate assembly protein [Komagataeibacter nataicola]PYD64922.1 baseplate assembly protein [Komagataeibacter nataicola]WNM08355.1 baseplate assembly protein [Komagataeibacter nataicola]
MHDPRMVASNIANGQAQPGFGIVSAVDPVNHAVKVMTQPSNVESGWLPLAAMQVGSLRISCPADIGTHVMVVHIEADAEHGVAAMPIYDAVVMPPTSPVTSQPAQPGELLIVAGCPTPPANGETAPGDATRNAPWWHITRDAIYSGAGQATEALTATSKAWKVGSVGMTLDANGLAVTGGPITTDKDMTAQGTVTGKADVLAAGISGKSHTHGGVQPGSGSTGAPQ